MATARAREKGVAGFPDTKTRKHLNTAPRPTQALKSAIMSENDPRLDPRAGYKIPRDCDIHTNAMRESAEERRRLIEAAQFERGYNSALGW